MQKSDFYYDLPEELIAQTPIEPRDSARLMVIDKTTGEINHKNFYDLDNILSPGDCLILNDTRVLEARLFAITENDSTVEVLLLNPHKNKNDVWEVLTGPGKKAKVGTKLTFSDELSGTVIDVLEGSGNRLIEFKHKGDFYDIIAKIGTMPLPHYIHEKLMDNERYQTVYNDKAKAGSAAAPTAGLHFTENLLTRLKDKGINLAFVTLNVGIGTFRPVKVDNIEEHDMHAEYFELPAKTAKTINNTRKAGGKVVCVGTTAVRTLESVAMIQGSGEISAVSGWTDAFIYPGYEYKLTDAMVTNFHLPESTLVMMVTAFGGYDNIMNAYKTAVYEKYRFFSFGDAMIMI